MQKNGWSLIIAVNVRLSESEGLWARAREIPDEWMEIRYAVRRFMAPVLIQYYT